MGASGEVGGEAAGSASSPPAASSWHGCSWLKVPTIQQAVGVNSAGLSRLAVVSLSFRESLGKWPWHSCIVAMLAWKPFP